MAKKKYVRDYEISETIDEKGRVRSVPIYVGSYFCFCDAAAAKKSGRLLAPAAALGWLAYIMALWLPSGAGKLMYVILPFVFAAVFEQGYLNDARHLPAQAWTFLRW